MKRNSITLYVNDPMGKRWSGNVAAARQVAEDLGTELFVIKNTSDEYGREENPPPCPSVAVNGRFIVSNGTITCEELKLAVENNG